MTRGQKRNVAEAQVKTDTCSKSSGVDLAEDTTKINMDKDTIPAAPSSEKPPITRPELAPQHAIHEAIVKALCSDEIRNKLVNAIVDAMVEQVTQSVYAAITLDLEQYNKKMQSLEDQISNLQHKVKLMEDLSEEQEQYSRRNCLRFQGIPEKPNENTDDLVRNIVAEKMSIQLTPLDVDRSHRISPRSGQTDDNKPRPIIMKFTRHNVRQEIYANRSKLKGTKIYIHEDLTRRRQDLINKARQSQEVLKIWTNDGRIKALLKSNKKVNIKNEKDIERLE